MRALYPVISAMLTLVACGSAGQSGAADAGQLEAAAPGQAPAADPSDVLVQGTEYHATGQIACSIAEGQPAGSCPFGVKREGNGSGMVTVTRPDGRTRTVFFESGKATGYDVSQADPGEFSASREGDMTIVRIGAERYELPDGIIYGG